MEEVQKLIKQLKDFHYHTDFKKEIIWKLNRAASDGKDITLAIPDLTKALEDVSSPLKMNAAEALVRHYLNKKDKNRIKELLSHKDIDIKWSAIKVLQLAAQTKEDITPFITDLAKALEDKHFGVKGTALGALIEAAFAGQDIGLAISALTKTLKDKDIYIKENAAKALAYYYLHKKDEKRFRKLFGHKDPYIRKAAKEVYRTFASIYPAKVVSTPAGKQKNTLRGLLIKKIVKKKREVYKPPRRPR